MIAVEHIFSAVERVKNCPQGSTASQCLTNLPQAPASTDNLQKLFSIWIGVAAALAVVTIVVAAFNFATAATDAEKVSRAKKSIALALIGLVIAISAQLIVQTLLGHI